MAKNFANATQLRMPRCGQQGELITVFVQRMSGAMGASRFFSFLQPRRDGRSMSQDSAESDVGRVKQSALLDTLSPGAQVSRMAHVTGQLTFSPDDFFNVQISLQIPLKICTATGKGIDWRLCIRRACLWHRRLCSGHSARGRFDHRYWLGMQHPRWLVHQDFQPQRARR